MRLKVPHAWRLVRQVAASAVADQVPSMGAALAYYTLFSLAPLLLIVVSLAGLVFGQEAARGEVQAQLSSLMGPQGAAAVQQLLASVRQPAEGLVATVVGVALLLWGATSVFNELQADLDRIWRAPAPSGEPVAGWFRIVRTRLLSFGLVLAMGFLMIVSLLVSAALAAARHGMGDLLQGWFLLAHVANATVDLGLVALMFAFIYKVMPRVHVQWRDVWVGAILTASLFAIGKLAISLYLGHSSVVSGFGAAGSLVVVLLWVYYSAQVFLLGAEFTWAFANQFGSRRPPATPADVMAPA